MGQAPSGSPAVAAALRQAREDAGLSRRRLAVLVGVTDVCVGLWERAQRTPGPENWVQLELTLGPLGVVRDPGPEAGSADAAAA
jgi:ribosome-binding protein aMBF1 (putative translation factor)